MAIPEVILEKKRLFYSLLRENGIEPDPTDPMIQKMLLLIILESQEEITELALAYCKCKQSA